MTLSPAIREILKRTRLARAALDARLGIMPKGVVRFMANENDKLAQGLSDEDMEFLKHADNLQGPYKKIQMAKMLIVEARAEIRAIIGDEVVTISSSTKKPKKVKKAKGKKAVEVSYEAPAGAPKKKAGLSEEQKLVVKAVTEGNVTRPAIDERTGFKPHVTKRILNELRAAGALRLDGHGRAAKWMTA